MSINVTFDPPLVTDAPEVFDSKAQQFASDLVPWTQQANALAQQVGDDAVAAVAAKGFAEAAHDAAEGYRDEAQTQALNAAAAVAAAAATWVANAAYTLNKLVWLTGSSGRLFRCITAHSGRSETPDSDPTYWVEVGFDSPGKAPMPAGWSITADANGFVFRRPDGKMVGHINADGVFTANDVARDPGLPS